MNRKIGIRVIATLILLLVSLTLFGCSPSGSPQENTKVLVLQPESQEEAAQESASEPVVQAKIAPQELSVDTVEEPAETEAPQPEVAGGVGGGAPEVQTFAQADPSPALVTEP